MEGAVKVLLLAALILLVSAQTFNNYRSLPDVYRVHIDKALKEANSKFGRGHHVAFHSLKGTPKTMASTLNVNAQLMVTTCQKTAETAYEHRDECYEQKKQTPWIDCLVCKTKDKKELVDCGTWREVQTKTRDNIRNNCVNYHTGGAHLFLKSEDNEKQIGCPGCM